MIYGGHFEPDIKNERIKELEDFGIIKKKVKKR